MRHISIKISGQMGLETEAYSISNKKKESIISLHYNFSTKLRSFSSFKEISPGSFKN